MPLVIFFTEFQLKHLKKLEAKQKTLQACILGNADDITRSLEENMGGNYY